MQTVLLDALVAILSAYLALSGALAGAIESAFMGEVPQEELPQEPVAFGTAFPRSLTLLPSEYAKKRSLLDTLLDNLTYQRSSAATVAGIIPNATHAPEEALVNIVCTRTEGNDTHTISGSGAFIDPRGVIITNAHVAQFLLLEDKGKNATTCTIRQGSPARDRFKADILHMSPLWIDAHLAQIDNPATEGTGERDYALLFVSEATDGNLPSSFPALALGEAPLSIKDHGRHVRALGYPADSKAPLSLAAGDTTITELFTFGDRTADVMAIASSSAGEKGSSGGAIVSREGDLLGLIVTQGDPNSGPRTLRALSLSYIDAAIQEETGFDMKALMRSDLKERSLKFKEAVNPLLAQIHAEEER